MENDIIMTSRTLSLWHRQYHYRLNVLQDQIFVHKTSIWLQRKFITNECNFTGPNRKLICIVLDKTRKKCAIFIMSLPLFVQQNKIKFFLLFSISPISRTASNQNGLFWSFVDFLDIFEGYSSLLNWFAIILVFNLTRRLAFIHPSCSINPHMLTYIKQGFQTPLPVALRSYPYQDTNKMSSNLTVRPRNVVIEIILLEKRYLRYY